jgi:hypothetical protein
MTNPVPATVDVVAAAPVAARPIAGDGVAVGRNCRPVRGRGMGARPKLIAWRVMLARGMAVGTF